MRLTRVTISGADDEVPHRALYNLSAEFPFVEWGLLYSTKRKGTPRYPSSDWLQRLELRQCQFAVHLCGQAAREAMGGADMALSHRSNLRVQLNGFSSYILPELLVARRYHETEFILQCSSLEALGRATGWRVGYPNISALWDQSGGGGVSLEHWPLPNGKLTIGYTGGLNENNIVEYLKKLTANRETDDFWVDMETGARTGGHFDLAKVRRYLELTKPFVATSD